MNWLFYVIYIICIVQLFYTMFFVKMTRKKAALIYGIGLIASPFLAIALSLVMESILELSGLSDGVELSEPLFASFIIFFLLNFFNSVIVSFMIDLVIGFHEQYNRANLHRNPVKFAVNNKSLIGYFYSGLMFAASILVFYGIWLGDKDLPTDADVKKVELISEKLGYDNFTKIEDGVYMTNDSLQIFVFLQEKWPTYIEKMDLKFPYDVIDYPTKEKYLVLPYPEYFSEFEFVGIIELYEHTVKLREYQNQQGKLYSKTDEDNVFWNIEAEQFDTGENITNIVIIK